MRVLFASARDTGAYQIRAKQIAATRPDEWRAQTSLDGAEDADLIVIVKWLGGDWPMKLLQLGKPIVLDPLDFWSQPNDSLLYDDELGAEVLFRCYVEQMPTPAGIIFATEAMQAALGHVFPVPSAHIYHHYRPGIARNPIRPFARTIVYEGEPRFIGEWAAPLTQICNARDMKFLVNPAGGLAEGDIAVAVRSRAWRGGLETNFKSNVKLANCYGSGTPCIVWPEAAVLETCVPEVRLFRNLPALAGHLEDLMDHETRKRTSEALLAAAAPFSVDAIAKQYELFFDAVMAPKQAA